MKSISGKRTMLGRAHAILILLLLAPVFQAASAQDASPNDVTVVDGPFYNSTGTSALVVVTMKVDKDHPQKIAGLMVQFQNIDEHYHFDGTYKKLVASFLSADEWQKFVSLWKTAHAANGESDAGDYFDGETELGLGTYRDGDISFTMAGNGHNANNMPNDIYIFELSPKDFAAFDDVVKQVSAYFEK